MDSQNDPRAPDWQYSGRELEAMSFATNYHRWILERLKPYLGKHIVEVGAGMGSFTELLIETRPDSLLALEPSADMFPVLTSRLLKIDSNGIAKSQKGTLGSLPAGVITRPPDSIVYLNVLEHIEDDEDELRTAYSLLSTAGRVLIFVPANRWLMGSMDRLLSHYRRYDMNELSSKCRTAGFNIRYRSYFDIFGVAPWWLKYCVLKSQQMEPSAVRLYDQIVVPFARILERMIPPPIGKNIILVAEKT